MHNHPLLMLVHARREGIEVVALVEEFYPKPKVGAESGVGQRERDGRAKHVFKVGCVCVCVCVVLCVCLCVGGGWQLIVGHDIHRRSVIRSHTHFCCCVFCMLPINVCLPALTCM